MEIFEIVSTGRMSSNGPNVSNRPRPESGRRTPTFRLAGGSPSEIKRSLMKAAAKLLHQTLAVRRRWRTRDGRKIRILDMENGHLLNAIAFLERDVRARGRRRLLPTMRREAARRGLQPGTVPAWLERRNADYWRGIDAADPHADHDADFWNRTGPQP